MKEHTIRNLTQVLTLISDYRENKIGLRYLVDSLEGIISALEERMSDDFYTEWDRSWAALEIALALNQEESRSNKIQDKLNILELLITKTLSDQVS
jgi:hypothetical protein